MNITDRYPVNGVDTSYYQCPIKYDVMAQQVYFNIIRAGDGYIADTCFTNTWNSLRNKTARGSYWFFRGNLDPREQANKYISVIRIGVTGELGHYIDVERPRIGYVSVSVDQYRRNLRTFTELLDAEFGVENVGYYSNLYYWNELLGGKLGIDLTKRKKWIAHWGVNAPITPAEWASDWDFWQYAEDKTGGKPYGVYSKGIDLNVYRYDLIRFKSEFRITFPLKPPSSTMPETPKAMRIIAANGLIRNSPNQLSGKIIGKLEKGSEWPVTELSKDSGGKIWCKVAENVYFAYELGLPIY